jgi:hypothetical protein
MPSGADEARVETLSMVAHLHANPRYRIRLGKVLDIGRPWVGGSSCDHLLVSLPYPYRPAFEHFCVGAMPVRIAWLMPITRTEAAFARANSVELLEQRLEQAGIMYDDPGRRAVV